MRAVELLERLRAHPPAARVLDALAGETGVHVVGGAVRDVLLGRVPAELDLVVEGDAAAVARRAAERLGGEAVAHERFGTATVRSPDAVFDLAGARRERYPRPGALPEVELGATIDEDLRRRDFTVNAIAVRLPDGALAAVPGARADLDARVLRVLHARSFADDPTRMLRMARYAARLGFAAAPETAALVRPGALATVTGPRIGAELRLLLREPQPAALVELDRRGLARAAIHPRLTVDAGLVARALALCATPLTALAAACAGLPAHELGARLDVLGFTARERAVAVAAAGRARELAGAGGARSEIARRFRGVAPEVVAVAGALGAGEAARWWLTDGRRVGLEITGDDLVAAGLRGPAVGRGLAAALAARLDGRALDRASQLETALQSGA